MRRSPLFVRLTALLAVLLGASLLASRSEASTPQAHRRASATPESVVLGALSRAPRIPASFVGLAFEYQTVATVAGPAADPDLVLDRLLENLAPGQRPIIRIGGDSTDHTWAPVRGVHDPGLTYALTPAWASSVATLATSTRARLILGVDLEMNRPELAAAEVAALARHIPAADVLAWEVGNEPDLYGAFPWYATIPGDPASGVYAEPSSYTFAEYQAQFDATARALGHRRLAGPTLGTPVWMGNLPHFLATEPAVREVTYHAYPLACYSAPGSPRYPTVAHLLSPAASDGLAAALAPYVREANATGRPFRVDEISSSCDGGQTGVSNTFASALWATDMLFAMADRGVSGINFQDYIGSRYAPFSFRRVNGAWTAQVNPIYYGMQLFTQAAPPGSRLVRLVTAHGSDVRAWAARTPSPGAGRRGPETVTLLNTSTTHSRTVTVRAAGTHGGTLTRMLAPSATATSGVSLGGLSYGTTTGTGVATGTSTAQPLAPARTYTVVVPAASAALLTLTR